MRLGSQTPVRMDFSPVPTDLQNKFASLRAGSEPNDLFNDRTGLRKSAFPIKLAGIMMGSQENLNASDDESHEFMDQWKRRSRRNSLSGNSPSTSSSIDRRSMPSNPTPFGPSALPNGKSTRRGSTVSRWGQRRSTAQPMSNTTTDDEEQFANSRTPSHSSSDKNLFEIKRGSTVAQPFSSTTTDDEDQFVNSRTPSQSSSDKNLSEIKSLLTEMQSDIQALGTSTHKFQESEKYSSSKIIRQDQILSTKQHTKEEKMEKSEKAEKSEIFQKSESSYKSERRMSNFMITSSVEIEENLSPVVNGYYLPKEENRRFSKTPDDLPRLVPVPSSGYLGPNGILRDSSFHNIEGASSVSVEETVVIRGPPIKQMQSKEVSTDIQKSESYSQEEKQYYEAKTYSNSNSKSIGDSGIKFGQAGDHTKSVSQVSRGSDLKSPPPMSQPSNPKSPTPVTHSKPPTPRNFKSPTPIAQTTDMTSNQMNQASSYKLSNQTSQLSNFKSAFQTSQANEFKSTSQLHNFKSTNKIIKGYESSNQSKLSNEVKSVNQSGLATEHNSQTKEFKTESMTANVHEATSSLSNSYMSQASEIQSTSLTGQESNFVSSQISQANELKSTTKSLNQAIEVKSTSQTSQVASFKSFKEANEIKEFKSTSQTSEAKEIITQTSSVNQISQASEFKSTLQTINQMSSTSQSSEPNGLKSIEQPIQVSLSNQTNRNDLKSTSQNDQISYFQSSSQVKQANQLKSTNESTFKSANQTIQANKLKSLSESTFKSANQTIQSNELKSLSESTFKSVNQMSQATEFKSTIQTSQVSNFQSISQTTHNEYQSMNEVTSSHQKATMSKNKLQENSTSKSNNIKNVYSSLPSTFKTEIESDLKEGGGELRSESQASDFRPFSQISITSDVVMVDEDDVIYHDPEERNHLLDVDVIEVNPEQVNYGCRMPEKAQILPQQKEKESKGQESKIQDTSSKDILSDDLVLSKDESEALEKLFDKLIDGEMSDAPKRSMTESSIGSSVGCPDEDADQGDASSEDDATEISANLEKLSAKFDTKAFWESRKPSTITTTKDDLSIQEKTRRKRKRNRTIDYHELPSEGGDLWCATVAEYTQRAFKAAENQNKASSTSDSEEGLGHGLGLIIDKLKNIETKLDELKTLDQSVWYPEVPDDCLSDSSLMEDYLNSTKSIERQMSDRHINEKVKTSKSSDNLSKSSSKNSIREMKAQKCDSSKSLSKICPDEIKLKIDLLKSASDREDDCDSDDRTLVDELEEQERCDSVETHTDENLDIPFEEQPDQKNMLICSPSPDPDPDPAQKSLTWPQRGHIRISSISSLSEDEMGHGGTQSLHMTDVEDDEEDLSIGRESRIEELAKKMMSKVDKESTENKSRTRHPSEPTPRAVNLELDTVSERSEFEDEEACDSGDQTDSNVKKRPPSTTSNRPFRTRSASRERALPKIRYCWRCHQTGHESFDCTTELNPDFWCPRCLESTHWEDSCWVNEKEIFCNICSLPGHLPCVHETSDFRQRKLVVETFGWLAFKDWFREPDFWSWWNCAGFTNVPLYKLMQHRPSH